MFNLSAHPLDGEGESTAPRPAIYDRPEWFAAKVEGTRVHPRAIIKVPVPLPGNRNPSNTETRSPVKTGGVQLQEGTRSRHADRPKLTTRHRLGSALQRLG
eukprot:4709818-Prymnesium_polylepis.1